MFKYAFCVILCVRDSEAQPFFMPTTLMSYFQISKPWAFEQLCQIPYIFRWSELWDTLQTEVSYSLMPPGGKILNFMAWIIVVFDLMNNVTEYIIVISSQDPEISTKEKFLRYQKYKISMPSSIAWWQDSAYQWPPHVSP